MSMNGFDLLHVEHWKPFALLGVDHPFLQLNSSTIINTWIIILILIALTLPVKWLLKNKTSAIRFVILKFISFFAEMCKQALGGLPFNHFAFVTSIFCFIALCNTISIIPWLEEPTTDLNTTLALGIIAFMYTQVYAIKEQGIKAYSREYFEPIFIMLPLNIIGKLATVISISFRLFGNIFGGSIISSLYFGFIQSWPVAEFFGLNLPIAEMLGIFSGINLIIVIFFGLFEGLLQAFVFAMLTLTYLSIALQKEEETLGEIR